MMFHQHLKAESEVKHTLFCFFYGKLKNTQRNNKEKFKKTQPQYKKKKVLAERSDSGSLTTQSRAFFFFLKLHPGINRDAVCIQNKVHMSSQHDKCLCT